MKIIISGGHLTPALALIDFIKANHPHDEIVFVGRIHSQDRFKQLAQEEKEIKKRNLKFISFNSPKAVANKPFLAKFIFPFSLLKSIFLALLIFKSEKPTLLLSFGGYLAIPLAIAAKLSRVKIVTHEQTRAAGFANQFIAKIADRVAISYPESKDYFQSVQTYLTGNPIRPDIISSQLTQPTWINQKKLKPILLITGGSQGSAVINQLIGKMLKKLTSKWTLIHLCGNANQKNNYRHQLELEKLKLPPELQHHYFVKEWASAQEMSWIYDHAHLAISRAGANTVMELILKKIPTIFIPLPRSHHNEQLKNAQQLVDHQATLILSQTQLSVKNLLQKIEELNDRHHELTTNLNHIKLDKNAVGNLYQLLLDLVHAK